MSDKLTADTIVLHETYNFQNQPERLKYLGFNYSGNGYWHQFEKVDDPGVVWCEVQSSELVLIEKSK